MIQEILKDYYVTIHCLTELRRNLTLELLAENEILLLEETATYYDYDNEDYAITVHPHKDSTSKLDRFLANARAIGLVASFTKQVKE